EERGADVVLLEVEREADHAVIELEHLHRDRVLEPVNAGDAVADLEDRADFGEIGLDVVLLDPLAQDRSDLFRTKLHVSLPLGLDEFLSEAYEPAANARVDPVRPGTKDDPTDE